MSSLGKHLALTSPGSTTLSASTRIPHIEGVMTDWLRANVSDTPYHQGSKTEKLRDVATTTLDGTPAYHQVVKSAFSFILDGPALSNVVKWHESLDTSFANRHAIAHGLFNERIYTEENSAKLFLMLDAICQILAAYRHQLSEG